MNAQKRAIEEIRPGEVLVIDGAIRDSAALASLDPARGRVPDRPADRLRHPPAGRGGGIGALVHPEHYARVVSYVQADRDQGARLVADTRVPRYGA